ncbi:MFS transporter [Shewanella sp. D64]|uniref:MFS transporter n=1 Tax=unclassified Shewanella TaxID=196818 RepID=UPI0022BA5FD5|nr:MULTISPECIES: MFS transporter [unclassified Shewanella]MEC4728117.1 MFS transporter [Shewanella sp. D64]MEC4740237.1 MFS transporter [Shewanella sp. E94]WBJ94444.1 MFS transporter [Shewanella sp. MTB7]
MSSNISSIIFEPNGSHHTQQNTLKRASTACFIGNFVEWFDYASYGFLATIIAVSFFPSYDTTTALMATFAIFALSFIVRPLGGIFWGHIGDKIGRKTALSMSIVIMSCATFSIALLPDYNKIGVMAPLLLLLIRMIQGFSASGEYAGAATFLTEIAPKEQKGFYASIVPASAAAGLLFGSLFVSTLYTFLSSTQLHEWGWRIPFLLAAPFGLIGLYIRTELEDSAQFLKFKENNSEQQSTIPLQILLVDHKKSLFLGFIVTSLNAVGFYLLLSYMPTYMIVHLDIKEATSFLISSVVLAFYIAFVFSVGKLSDIFGRGKILILATLSFIFLSIPIFILLEFASIIQLTLILILFSACLALNDGCLSCYLCELFPTNVRYSGFALSFNSANALFGGTAPFVATSLIAVTGLSFAPGFYLMLVAIMTLIAMILSYKR